MFDEYANIINQKYPILIVDGANYDPPNMNMLLARFLVSNFFLETYVHNLTFIKFNFFVTGIRQNSFDIINIK